MKREYVKPVMESEEFVANEYVGACWLIVCNDGEQMIVHDEPNFDWNPITGEDGFIGSKLDNKYYYTGKIDGQDGEGSVTLFGHEFAKVHTLKSWNKKGDSNGPNAS